MFTGLLSALYLVLSVALQRQSERRALRELDDRTLRDIGLRREDVERQARKPIWRN